MARLFFAATAGLHYLFVATTLGLGPLVAVMSTRAALRSRKTTDGALEILGRLYAINYAIGIITGLTMELQVALVWSGPGAVVYEPIATMLALETVLAFFLESTLLGIWLAGAGVLSKWVRAMVFWGVTATAYASATFIVGANSFMHNPTATTDPVTWDALSQVLFRPASLTVLLHSIASSLVVGGFWTAAAGARITRHGGDSAIARRLVRIGVITVTWSAPLSAVSGVAQFPTVRTAPGTPGPFGPALGIMIGVGLLITVLTWTVVLPLSWRGSALRSAVGQGVLMYGVAIPLATTFLGWLYRETARQPWFVVGRATTAEAMNPLPSLQLTSMGVFFIGISAVSAAIGWRHMYRAMHTRPQVTPPVGRDLEPLGWT